MAIKLLDMLIFGVEVELKDVMSVRSALVEAGSNSLWQPVGFDGNSIAGVLGADAEVNEALEQLLGAGQRKKVG